MLHFKLFPHIDFDKLSIEGVFWTGLPGAPGVGNVHEFVSQIVHCDMEVTGLDDGGHVLNRILWGQGAMKELKLILECD